MASSREQRHLDKIALSENAHEATKSLGGLLAGDRIEWEPRDHKEEEWKLDLEKNPQLHEEVETNIVKIFESLEIGPEMDVSYGFARFYQIVRLRLCRIIAVPLVLGTYGGNNDQEQILRDGFATYIDKYGTKMPPDSIILYVKLGKDK